MAYLVGDIVTNMRSALDHAIAQVARRDAGLSDQDLQRLRLQFPICSDEASFRSAAKRLGKVLPSEVVEKVEALQPFNEAPEDSIHNLAMLRDLSNLDKHWQLSIVAHGITKAVVRVDPPFEDVSFREGTGKLEGGAVIATVVYRRPANPPEILLEAEVHHVESLYVPWSDTTHPLAVVLELIFESAFTAVLTIVEHLMRPIDELFVRAHFEALDQRRDALIATIVSPIETDPIS